MSRPTHKVRSTRRRQWRDRGGRLAKLVEICLAGMISPKNPNIIYGVLNRLTRYDIREKKLLAHAELDHSYSAVTVGTPGDMALTTPQIFVR